MTVLLDTSTLVAALVESHPRHAQAFPWLRDLRGGSPKGMIAAHSVAETYAVLSTLPVSPRISPSSAWALLEHSVLPFVSTVELSVAETKDVISRMSRRGLSGGVIYDALIAAAGIKGGAEILVTLNPADFRRIVDADGPPEVRAP